MKRWWNKTRVMLHGAWKECGRICRWCVPCLDLWLDIGLLKIHTELMHECFAMRQYNVIHLHVKLLGKWGFRFRLYRTVN